MEIYILKNIKSDLIQDALILPFLKFKRWYFIYLEFLNIYTV